MKVWIVFMPCDGYGDGGWIEAVFAQEEEARAFQEAKGFTMYGKHKDYRFDLEEWSVNDGNIHST